MDYCKRAETFVCKVALFILLASTATFSSSLPGALLCRSSDNMRVISSIAEDITVGSPVAQVTVAGNSSQINLVLDSRNVSFGFLLNSTSRTLTIGKQLEIQWPTSVNYVSERLVIRCSPIMLPSLEVELKFFVKIWDINNNAPMFVNAPYVVNMSEWTPAGTSIISSIDAADLDPSDRGYLSYSIDEENRFAPNFIFPVPSVGEIVLQKLLNYEQVETINLTIYVKDNSNNHTTLGLTQPQFTSTSTVIINVIRPRLYHPTFTAFTFIGVISRSTLPESVVNVTPSIAASTDTANVVHAVNYNIIRDQVNEDDKYFRLDNATGQLTTILPIAASASNSLAFQIKVFESSRPWYFDTALVKVVVTDADNETQCLALQRLHYSAMLAEDTPVGSHVVHVQLQQLPCQSNSHVFSLVSDISHKYFTVNTSTGEVRTAATLLDTAESHHTLIVKVTDGVLTNFSTVSVEVRRAPHRDAPYFSEKLFTFSAKSAAGVVGSIRVNADNTRENVTYTLLINPQIKPAKLFVIDGDGQLIAVDTLVQDTYTMAVVARDESPIDTALIVVHVQDVSTPATAAPAAINHMTVIVIVGVCVVLLLLVLLIVCCIIKCRRRAPRNKLQPRHNATPTVTECFTSPSIIHESRYQLADRSVISSSCGKTVSVNSVNSFPSENGAYKSYDVDSDGRSVRKSGVGGMEVGLARQPPHHAAEPVDGYSLKSYSTTSQLSAAAEQRDDEASLMDPSVSGSTVTLMAHSAECDESLQGINNIPSPDGSTMSIPTQQRVGSAPGITVYY